MNRSTMMDDPFGTAYVFNNYGAHMEPEMSEAEIKRIQALDCTPKPEVRTRLRRLRKRRNKSK